MAPLEAESAELVHRVARRDDGQVLVELSGGDVVEVIAVVVGQDDQIDRRQVSDLTTLLHAPEIEETGLTFEANATIVLKNIFFDVNRYDLQPESQVELDKLVQLMKENPTLEIQINGHTDNVGKPADNLTLSENRAKAVVTYLRGKGIDTKRLSFKGWGDSQPVADNHTEAGRALNRRTELKVISK